MNQSELLYDVSDSVATITLNRPDRRNALTADMFRGVVDHTREAERDDDVKAIVLRGNGPSFSAGYDMSDADQFYGGAEGRGPRFLIGVLRERAELMRALMYSTKTTVASVHSHCLGAGLYFVLACDMAVAAEDALFGFPEERQGTGGAAWVYHVLASQVGTKMANELLLTGRKFDAEEARALGLLNRVVSREELAAETDELAKAVCSVSRDGLAVGKAFRHLAYDALGLDRGFAAHYAVHPLAAQITHEQDEFSFRDAVRESDLKTALAERQRRFGGRFWGW